MPYTVIIPKPVQKQLKQLSPEIYQRIITKISQLADEPRPAGVKKLKGFNNEYRIRIGNYRVRYEINDSELIIILVSCRHRRDVYRD
ncbi:type II toxin-antitoxin system RelE/ParE family toxin [Crocosphaera sp.]|uniref:type II toxin-antitoxin system RelE family toxin n=1 Tax=Crocosphaera sp. TaxID=2729996 RepID=UPI002630F639|nr:type II toxin-antitoxin system RelE/ParE family toxin [Crocosphaera sp.]MDJ0581209.1 type II toxin-antitoxin system RelE/ParE family toxin [Crocosphaera sp.]